MIDFSTRKIVATWPIPGGGSPDMGNVTADGKTLWLSGRYDNVVYAIDTTSGHVTEIPVGIEPHGLTVWPQPGRYSSATPGTCDEARVRPELFSPKFRLPPRQCVLKHRPREREER